MSNKTPNLLVAMLAILVIAGWSCDEAAQAPPPAGPTLAYSPHRLSFDFDVDPGPKTLSIWNDGTGTLAWTARVSDNWLSLSADADSSDGEVVEVMVSVDYNLMTKGILYQGSVAIEADGVSDTVAVDAFRGNKQVCVTPDILIFRELTDPGPKKFAVQSCGDGSVVWNAQSQTSWIRVTPQVGNSGGEWDSVEVLVRWADLANQATFPGEIDIFGPNNTVTLPVVAITSGPRVEVDTESIICVELTSPGPKSFSIRNSGDGVLNWNVSANNGSLSFSETSGSSTGEWDEVGVTINWDAVSGGATIGAVITVAAGDGGSKLIQIRLTPLPRFTIVHPEQGTMWTMGRPHSILWTSNLAANFVQIELYQAQSRIATITSSMSNTGSLTWTVPTNLTAGSDFQVRIKDVQSNNDAFSGMFTITDP